MKPLARIIVKETAGIRRFLFPMMLGLDGPAYNPAPESSVANVRVSELDGTLLPSESWPLSPGDEHWRAPYSAYFALSLAPYEERELLLVETDEVPTIPDAMRLAYDQADGLTTRQERVSFHIGSRSGLDSVVYDQVEHLAGPLVVSLDGKALSGAPMLRTPVSRNLGLVAEMEFDNPAPSTGYRLTACKSWVTVMQMLRNLPGGQTIVFSLPLRVVDTIPICDFGVGNGVYEKIAGDAVVWTTEFDEEPYARWRVGTINAGVEKIDYQGEYQSTEDFARRAWFHWSEKSKALAVAIHRFLPPRMSKLTVTLSRDGKIDIAFTLPADASGALVSVCYHFLNDIPPIAAATNPASILLPPMVTVAPL